MPPFVICLLAFLTGAKPLQYADSVYHFKTSYPSDWSAVKKNATTAFMCPKEGDKDYFQQSLSIMPQNLGAEPMGIDKYSELQKKQIASVIGDSLIESLNSINIGGNDAREFIFYAHYNGMKLKIRQNWFLKGNIAYVFTFTAETSQFNQNEAAARGIVENFRLY